MVKRVGAIMHVAPVSVNMADTVFRVEEVLDEHNLTSVPVVDPVRKDCFGIISLKDIRHFHSTNRNPREIRAWEICSYRPLQMSSDTPVKDVAELMVQQGIHHVVIVDDKVVTGFISSLDVIGYLLSR